MAHFIDDTAEIKIQDIDSEWVTLQIETKTCVLSYDAAVDLAVRLALVTSKMDNRSELSLPAHLN